MADAEQVQETPEIAPPPTEPVGTTEAPPAGDAPVAEEPQSADSDQEETPEDEATPEAKHKRKGGYQRQIEREQREKQMLLEQNRILAEQLQRLTAPTHGSQKEQTPAEQATNFIDNLVEKKWAAKEAEREQQLAMAEVERKEQAFRSAHDDYDEAFATFRSSGLPQAHIQAILTSAEPPAIMYELAKNPAALARIRALPPLNAAVEIGMLGAKLASGATPQTKPNGTARKPAPAPITPVTTRGPTTVKRTEDMTYEEYNAWRDGQRKR